MILVPGGIVSGQRLAGEGAPQRVALELVGQHRRTAQRGERGRPDETLCRLRLDHAHGVPLGCREAHELERLVPGDSPADAEQQAWHDG